MNEKRISYNIIKIMAICLVIYNHTGENGYELFRCANSETLRTIAIIIDVICKAGVPLFFMASGALLLGREEKLQDIFLKRVIRYLIIIVFFSFLYYIRLYMLHPEYGFSIVFFIKYIYSTPFVTPFWFLYLYLGFLIMLPVLRAIVKGMDISGYVLIFGLMLLMDYIVVPEYFFGFEHVNLSFGILENNIIYPLLGYAIANVADERWFNKGINNVLAGLFTLNLALSIVMNYMEYRNTGEFSGQYIDQFSYVSSVVIFYFIIYIFEIKSTSIQDSVAKIINYIGSCTLGIYLFEETLRSDVFLKLLGMASNQFAKLLLCIPYTLGIAASGVLISSLIRRIPVINKLKI